MVCVFEPFVRQLLPWSLVWVVLLACALLPARRALAQAALVLTISAGVIVGSGLPDGSLRVPMSDAQSWFEMSATLVLVGLVMRRLGRSLHQRATIAEAVARLGQQALSANEPDELLQAALRAAVDLLHTDYGTALRLLPDGRLRVAGELGPESLPAGTILPVAASGSYARRIVESVTPLVSFDLRRDPRVTPPALLLQRGVVSGLAVPLVGADRALGVLAVHSRRRRRFAAHEVSMVQALATVVATAWEQAAYRDRLSHQALHDPLTGLPNRTLLLDRLDVGLERRPCHRAADPAVAVALIDLDRFKSINDRLGHAAGDVVLQTAAHRLAAVSRPEDTLARFGGDEFALLCDAVADPQIALEQADRMLAALTQPVTVEGAILTVTASAGVAVTVGRPGQPASAEALLREADIALYRAKEHGGGVELFSELMQSQLRADQRLEAELRKGIDRQEFTLHYQPIRSVVDHRVLGVEALIRWRHPERGLLPPSEFLPLAEQTSLIVPLGRWVLRTACEQAAAWQRELPRPPGRLLRIAVNVSPRQLEDPGLPEQVADAIDASDLAPGTLALELTETALLDGGDSGQAALCKLRAAGAALILDDFGTGYSSLTHLARFPIEALKIDRSFVAGLDQDPRDTAIVSAVIALGAKLAVEVIAEGVETHHQLGILREMGCQAVQGFLLDSPQPQPSWLAPRVDGAWVDGAWVDAAQGGHRRRQELITPQRRRVRGSSRPG